MGILRRLWLVVWVVLAGCASTHETPGNPLRVGVMADYPPIVFYQEGELAGLEVDFAHQLGDCGLGGEAIDFVDPNLQQTPM